MFNAKPLPTNVTLLELTKEKLKGIRPVTSLDITDGATDQLHPDGLYSVEIFGPVGSPERDIRLSYIDIKVPILKPKVYRDLVRLKAIYGGILSGRVKAVFDETLNDFVASTAPEADTGYGFFMQHFDRLHFRPTNSPARMQRIEFINKHRAQATTRYAVVMPAGLRDIEVSDTGRKTKHEVNDLYFRMLSISNLVHVGNDVNSSALDIARYQLTLTYLAVYELIEQMVEGKRGFALNKFASRRVSDSTRNVISVSYNARTRLGARNSPGHNDTTMGLWQLMRGMPAVTAFFLRRMVSDIFESDDARVGLINPKTLQLEYTDINSRIRDQWTTADGLNGVINQYINKEARHRPVTVNGYYLFLVYRKDSEFRVFRDIRELPSDRSAKDVHPMTLCELLYLSGYRDWNNYIVYTTRYPVNGEDSTYPASVYVKTTVVGDMVHELDSDWMPLGEDYVALEFPRREMDRFWDSQSPASCRLTGLGGD